MFFCFCLSVHVYENSHGPGPYPPPPSIPRSAPTQYHNKGGGDILGLVRMGGDVVFLPSVLEMCRPIGYIVINISKHARSQG